MTSFVQELLFHATSLRDAKRIFLRVLGYHDLYTRRRNPDAELTAQIADEAALEQKIVRAQNP